MPSKNPLPRLREIRDAQKAASELTRERDRLIRRATKAGYSRRRVAVAAGISPAQVQRIWAAGKR